MRQGNLPLLQSGSAAHTHTPCVYLPVHLDIHPAFLHPSVRPSVAVSSHPLPQLTRGVLNPLLLAPSWHQVSWRFLAPRKEIFLYTHV